MADYDIIVIGSSAGGVIALRQLVAALPANFKIPIFIVQHVAPGSDNFLAQTLDQAGPLPAVYPRDGAEIVGGTIYVAPPDYHLLVEAGRILVKRGPKENSFRPSIDALFRSAAYAYGTGAIGIILTGLLDDGSSGTWSLKRMGGKVIVQDPRRALYPSMPLSVLQHVKADHVCSLSEISDLLASLAENPELENAANSPEEIKLLKMEVDIASIKTVFRKSVIEMGEPSSLTCPDCGGALNTFIEGELVRYRCHTGHAYSSTALLSGVIDTTEHKLWAALRSLEEAIMIVEKEAAVLQNATGQLPLGHSVKLRALEKQTGELHNFLNHYLQFNALVVD